MKTRKFISVLSVLAPLMGPFTSYGRLDEERSKILKIYNWGNYTSEDVLMDFPKWCKKQADEEVRITCQVFGINKIMLTKIERGHEDFDLVCSSGYILERMLRKNLLLPIDRNFGKIPSYIDNVSPYIREELNKLSQPDRKTTDYVVPYMWGTTGLLYNRADTSRDEAMSWKCLWDLRFRSKILMKDSCRDAYGTTIVYAHARELVNGAVTVEQLMNDSSPEMIAITEEYLREMKPSITGWEADFGKEMMTKGRAWLNFTWSGDAVWAMEEAGTVGVDLGYEVPLEDNSIWYSGWAIPECAHNMEAVSYFMDCLYRPNIVSRNMEVTGYIDTVATPEILAEETDTTLTEFSDVSYFFGPGVGRIQIDPVQYPDRKVVERCVMIHDFGNGTEVVLGMWGRVEDDNLNSWIVVLVFTVFDLLFVWVIYKRINRYQQKRQHRGCHSWYKEK